jgi:sugar phosphate isomerase/epimerase
MTLETFIDFCAREGLEGVELTSYYFTRTDPAYLNELKRRVFLNGLTVTGTPVGNNFCLPPGAEREKEIAHVKDWIERAALLGSPCMRIFSGGAPKGHGEEEAFQWAVECLKEVAGHAGRHGVVLALENHGGLTSTADQLIRHIEAVSSPWLGVNLDTGNFNRRPYAEIEKAAPHAVVVQMKVEVAGEDGKKEPTDIPRVLEILKKAGYRGAIALEYEAAEDPRTAVPRWLKALKKAVSA